MAEARASSNRPWSSSWSRAAAMSGQAAAHDLAARSRPVEEVPSRAGRGWPPSRGPSARGVVGRSRGPARAPRTVAPRGCRGRGRSRWASTSSSRTVGRVAGGRAEVHHRRGGVEQERAHEHRELHERAPEPPSTAGRRSTRGQRRRRARAPRVRAIDRRRHGVDAGRRQRDRCRAGRRPAGRRGPRRRGRSASSRSIVHPSVRGSGGEEQQGRMVRGGVVVGQRAAGPAGPRARRRRGSAATPCTGRSRRGSRSSARRRPSASPCDPVHVLEHARAPAAPS